MEATQKIDSKQAETRQLLLQAAGEVFARVGFHNATVREICQLAGANIASVNYHFGDKEQLYLEVLRFAQTYAHQKYPSDLGVAADAKPEDRLKGFVRAFLLRLFDEGPIAWHAKLMAREMVDPTSALDTLVKEKFHPQSQHLMKLVRLFLEDEADDETVRLCGCSVISQCLFYLHCRPVIQRLFPQQQYSPEEIEVLANHITQFSVAALKQRARQFKKKH